MTFFLVPITHYPLPIPHGRTFVVRRCSCWPALAYLRDEQDLLPQPD